MWLFAILVETAFASLTLPLSNGLQFPLVGLGTAGGVREEAVRWAYEAGVRLFDTAQATEWYNEASVAAGLQGLPRESYWLETKLHPRDLGYESTLVAFPKSLTALNTTYIDVFLLHFPRCFSMCDSSPGNFHDSWKALEKLYREGVVKAIGVSNFDTNDLKTLLREASIVPHVLQNYFDPLHQDREVREMCKKNNIVYQGYSTLGTQWMMKGSQVNPVLSHPLVAELAAKYRRSPAQIVLAWALHRGVAMIPRSVVREKIVENANIEFDMDAGDLERMDALDGQPVVQPIEVSFVNAHDRPDSDCVLAGS